LEKHPWMPLSEDIKIWRPKLKVRVMLLLQTTVHLSKLQKVLWRIDFTFLAKCLGLHIYVSAQGFRKSLVIRFEAVVLNFAHRKTVNSLGISNLTPDHGLISLLKYLLDLSTKVLYVTSTYFLVCCWIEEGIDGLNLYLRSFLGPRKLNIIPSLFTVAWHFGSWGMDWMLMVVN